MSVFRKKQTESKPRGGRLYKRTPVNTYYRAKPGPNQASPFKQRLPKKRPHRFLIGLADIILIVALLYLIVSSLSVSPDPKVTVTDLTYRPASDYQSSVESAFSGINNRTKITFDQSGVTKRIEQQYPEVEAVQTELPFFSGQAKVKLIISPPAFKLTNQTQSVIVDGQGVSVARAASLPKSNLISVNDQSGFDIKPGRQVLSSQAVDFIQTLIKQSKQAKVPIATLILPAKPQELDVRTTDQAYYVKFYLGGDPSLQTGQFLATRQKFAVSNITPAEYLDVRVAGKVFYK